MSGFYSWHGKGGSITIYNDGVLLGDITTIDFTGAGQSGSVTGDTLTENIPGSASLTIYTETPSGVINGVNTTYTTTHTITSIFSFGINNALIQPTGQYAYSFTGNTITFVTPLDISLAGTPFTIVYA